MAVRAFSDGAKSVPFTLWCVVGLEQLVEDFALESLKRKHPNGGLT